MIAILKEVFVNIIVTLLPGPKGANRPTLILVQKAHDPETR